MLSIVKLAHPRKAVALLASVACVAIGVSSCSTKSGNNSKSGNTATSGATSTTGNSTKGQSSGPDTITIADNVAPLSLDPAKTSGQANSQIYFDLAYESLIKLDPNGKLTPGLAASWKFTDSVSKKFQVTLRPGVKFSDGTPLTAAAVIASINHEKTAGGPNDTYVKEIASAVATSPSVVTLNLVQSDPDFALTLSQKYMTGAIVAPAGVKNPNLLGTATYGAGAYMLDPKQTVANDHYTFVPNPYYFDKSAVHFQKFIVKVITNPTTALSALKSGEVSFALGSASDASNAKAAGLNVVSTLSSIAGAFLIDRSGKLVPALANQKVRQALNYAVDREGIAKALYGSYGAADDMLLPAGYDAVGYDPNYAHHYNYDVAKAKTLLAQAGYPKGFTLNIGATAAYGNGVAVAQALANDWAKIGVTLKIDSFNDIGSLVGPWQGEKEALIAGDYDGISTYQMFNILIGKNAGLYNPWKVDDPALDQLAAKAYANNDQSKAPALWQAVQDRVVDLGWFVPIASTSSIYFTAKNLQGVAVTPTSYAPDPTLWHF